LSLLEFRRLGKSLCFQQLRHQHPRQNHHAAKDAALAEHFSGHKVGEDGGKDRLGGEDGAGVTHSRRHALACLLHGCVGQAADGQGGQAGRDVYLQRDDCSLRANHGATGNRGKHGRLLTR